MSEAIAEKQVATVMWSDFRSISGPGESVGRALRRLLLAESPEEVGAARWGVEGHAVVQGQVFEVAAPATSVLVAAFADARPRWVRIVALDLIYQILTGYPSPCCSNGQALMAECERRVKEGLYLILAEALYGESEAAWDVLDLLETEIDLGVHREV